MGVPRAGALLGAAVALGFLAGALPPAAAGHWWEPLAISWYYPGVAYAGDTLDFTIYLVNGLAEPLDVKAITVAFAWEPTPREWGGMVLSPGGSGGRSHPVALPPAPGNYPVAISVMAATAGELPETRGPATRNLTVFDPPRPPRVLIRASPPSGPAPLVVTFTANVTGGLRPFAYAWDFGDGNGSAEASPTHRYGAPGTYRVQVAVTDRRNRTAWDNTTVDVGSGAPPLAPLVEGAWGFPGGYGLPLALGGAMAAGAAAFALHRRARRPPRETHRG